jgi:hypothetical protein
MWRYIGKFYFLDFFKFNCLDKVNFHKYHSVVQKGGSNGGFRGTLAQRENGTEKLRQFSKISLFGR